MSQAAPYRARTIVLHGPESTGKSVLSEKLSAHFSGVCIPEYGRTYCEIHGTDCDAQDLLNIAAGQDAAIDAAGGRINRLLFSDTDAVLTEVWSHMMLGESCFKDRPPRLSGALYLLTDIDTPFVQDHVRVYGEDTERKRFLTLSEAALNQYGLDYVRLSGDWEAREAAAYAAIEARFSDLLRS